MSALPNTAEFERRLTVGEQKLIQVCRNHGAYLAPYAVCDHHHAPLDIMKSWIWHRPDVVLVLGNRGGGKSFLRALATHLESARDLHPLTNVLGGSEAQSKQTTKAIAVFDRARPGHITRLAQKTIRYVNGSEVSVLPASQTAVRGPHGPTLVLDEVDEIDPELKEAAQGMCMNIRMGRKQRTASLSMTSTWHRLDGPMSKLIDQGRAGAFPVFEFCIFESLERCTTARSGPNLENCPECPIVEYCHDTSHRLPKAKRSSGHYSIDAFVQKTKTVAKRVLEADYLCAGPRADGLWFPSFEEKKHVSESAEYDHRFPVDIAVDLGDYTGAIWYQVIRGDPTRVHVFADYLRQGGGVGAHSRAILEQTRTLCNGQYRDAWADPAGSRRNDITDECAIDLCRAEGLNLAGWPYSKVLEGLEFIESLLSPAYGSPNLIIHPRCKGLINGFRSYSRRKIGSQWVDAPKDPQHPHEDIMDALRGGLMASARGPTVFTGSF